MLFDKLKNQFFKQLIGENHLVYWDSYVITDGTAFKIFDNSTILISEKTLIQPRGKQVSILIHILIHLYLYKASNGAIKLSHHDDNFRKIMLFFNNESKSGAAITICHNFTYSPEQESYSNQWWQCSGVCQNYQPFNGIIRSKTVPNELLEFWQVHSHKCPGSFFKIFPFYCTNSKGEKEFKFFRNVSYMIPTVGTSSTGQLSKSSRVKTEMQVREQIDLTDESEEAAAVVNSLIDIVNLDESQFVQNSPQSAKSCIYYTNFVSSVFNFCQCAFCQEFFISLGEHFDFCTGFQQNVDIKFRMKK